MNVFSQNNSKDRVKVYDINDLSNPKCPCHVYQKIADEEFKASKEKVGRIHLTTFKVQLINPKQKKDKGFIVFSKALSYFKFLGKKRLHARRKRSRNAKLFKTDIAACSKW